MSIKTTILCDAMNCSNELDVDDCDTVSSTIHYMGWHNDPNHGGQHYCDTCWPRVALEIQELRKTKAEAP